MGGEAIRRGRTVICLGRSASAPADTGPSLGRDGAMARGAPVIRLGGGAGGVLVTGRRLAAQLGGDHLDAGAMGVPGHPENPAGTDEAGDGELGSVRLDPAGVQLEDLVVASAIPKMVLRDLPQALVVTASGRLHHIDLL